MSRMVNVIIIACYSALALGMGLALPILFDDMGTGQGLLAGLVLFLIAALAHEITSRRANEARMVRHIRALKKAYDQTRAEMEAYSANAGGYAPRPAPPAPRLSAAPEEAIEPREPAAPEAPPPAAEAPEPRAANEGLENELGQMGDDAREVAQEVKVLHALVEQLYAEADQPLGGPRKDRAAKGEGASGKSGLRLVKTDDEDALLDMVRDGLREDRVDLYLQPIVSLPQRKRRFYESFLRIRTEDGTVISDAEYQPVAEKAQLTGTIDNMLLFRSLQLLRQVQSHDYSIAFFCNVAPESLLDDRFFKDFSTYMGRHAELAPGIVLEVSHADLRTYGGTLIERVRVLGRMGYRFSLDEINDLDLNIGELASNHFQYAKVNAQVIIDLLRGGEESQLRALKQQLDQHSVDLIITGIETEQMLIELLDFNIDYGQGYLFGEPRHSKSPVDDARAG